jgi:excisionase family DNA binding protein
MQQGSLPQLLDVWDVAQKLRVSPHTVRRWKALGKLRPLKLGRRILFHPDDVARFINQAQQGCKTTRTIVTASDRERIDSQS